MATLYIDRKDVHVKLDGNALAFYTEAGREGTAPLLATDRIVFSGAYTIDGHALAKIAGLNIPALFLSGRHSRFCGTLRGEVHRNGLLRVSQYKKSIDPAFSLGIAKEIVSVKLTGQLSTLGHIKDERHDIGYEMTCGMKTIAGILETVGEAPSIESLLGYEGAAGAAYFGAFSTAFAPSLGFHERNRRPPRDPVNALLSLTYTMLHFESLSEVEKIGFDPTIGFLHAFDYGRDSLACDVMEPYRPYADRFVWELMRGRRLSSADFSSDKERPGCYLRKEGRKIFYFAYEDWIREETRSQIRLAVQELARKVADDAGTKTEWNTDDAEDSDDRE